MQLLKQSIVFTALGFLSTALATSIYPLNTKVTGSATWNGGAGYTGGTCMMDAMDGASYITTAMSDQGWFGADICGACLRVFNGTGTAHTDVIVTNECPGCGSNHVDLDPRAFQNLWPLSKGVVSSMQWEIIPCTFTQPVEYHWKTGTSAYYFAVQVLYHNLPIVKLEVSTNNGNTWTNVPRENYNYFTYPSGFGNNVLTIRITAENGVTLVDSGLSVIPDAIVKGKKNF